MSRDSYILWNLYMQICDVPLKVMPEICGKCLGRRCQSAGQGKIQGHHEKNEKCPEKQSSS